MTKDKAAGHAGHAVGRAGHARSAQEGAAGSWASGSAGAQGRGARARERGSRRRAQGSRRGALGLGVGRPAWARGLAMGCALGALGLFSIRIDSVLFLSQFLDIVHEPGS